MTPDILRSWVRAKAAMLTQHDPALIGCLERDLAQHTKSAMRLCRTVTRRWLGLIRRPGG